MTTEDDVLEAARHLVEVFGAHDVSGYFDCFAADASFVFPNCAEVLGSRADYEALWAEWERDGFRVTGCESANQRVQLVGDAVAVFTHDVRTQLAGEPDVQRERETILFRRDADGRWLAVHEHLSADAQLSS